MSSQSDKGELDLHQSSYYINIVCSYDAASLNWSIIVSYIFDVLEVASEPPIVTGVVDYDTSPLLASTQSEGLQATAISKLNNPATVGTPNPFHSKLQRLRTLREERSEAHWHSEAGWAHRW